MTLDVEKSKSLEVIKFKTNGKKAEGDKKMKDEIVDIRESVAGFENF